MNELISGMIERLNDLGGLWSFLAFIVTFGAGLGVLKAFFWRRRSIEDVTFCFYHERTDGGTFTNRLVLELRNRSHSPITVLNPKLWLSDNSIASEHAAVNGPKKRYELKFKQSPDSRDYTSSSCTLHYDETCETFLPLRDFEVVGFEHVNSALKKGLLGRRAYLMCDIHVMGREPKLHRCKIPINMIQDRTGKIRKVGETAGDVEASMLRRSVKGSTNEADHERCER